MKFEDYFTNGIHYPQIPLFVGAPNKIKHIETAKQYFGNFKEQGITWHTIRTLIRTMFSNDYGGVVGKNLGFYGNAGVCLFKYFVDKSDPQHMFSLFVLFINFICFIVITNCYILVWKVPVTSSRSFAGRTQNPEASRKARNMQRKIALMISTDFLCWIPVIITSLLHFCEIIDATSYYGFFSIVVLPINSLINPLI